MQLSRLDFEVDRGLRNIQFSEREVCARTSTYPVLQTKAQRVLSRRKEGFGCVWWEGEEVVSSCLIAEASQKMMLESLEAREAA